MTTAGWASCLDSFADHLAHQRAVLAAGTPELISAFAPHDGLGQLPLSLAARARELQTQSDALTDQLTVQLARTAAALAELRQPAERPRPSYVDSRC